MRLFSGGRLRQIESQQAVDIDSRRRCHHMIRVLRVWGPEEYSTWGIELGLTNAFGEKASIIESDLCETMMLLGRVTCRTEQQS